MSVARLVSVFLALSFASFAAFAQQQFPYNPANPQTQGGTTQSQVQQPNQVLIADPAQLVGKRINVNRLPLCEPGTYKGDLAHAGMEATVLSAKPGNTPALQKSVLERLSPAAREMLLDQQKAALLLLRFDDGATRDTCAAIGPKKLSEYVQMGSGQQLGPVPGPVPSPATTPVPGPTPGPAITPQLVIEPARDIGEPQKNAGGKWLVESIRNKLTDVVSEQFNLFANNEVHDGAVTSRPALAIVCRAGHLNEAEFQTGIVLNTPAIEERGLFNVLVPVHYVRVRLDNKISQFSWEQMSDSKSMQICCTTFSGKGQIEKILKGHDVRIEFGSFDGYAEVAEFDPSGLDAGVFRQLCGLKL